MVPDTRGIDELFICRMSMVDNVTIVQAAGMKILETPNPTGRAHDTPDFVNARETFQGLEL